MGLLRRWMRVAAALPLAGCGLFDAFEGTRLETLSLRPASTAHVFAMRNESFGVCNPFGLDLRGLPRSAHRDALLFGIGRGAPFVGPVGHEVHVSRGQSCHTRSIGTSQTAIRFDVSGSLGDARFVRARLVGGELRDGGLDAALPLRGCREVPREAGVARVDWSDPGSRTLSAPIERVRLPAGAVIPNFLAAPIPYDRVGRWPATRGIDVTGPVRDWISGSAPNDGFVLSPNAEALAAYKETIDLAREAEMCSAFATDVRLELDVLVPDA